MACAHSIPFTQVTHGCGTGTFNLKCFLECNGVHVDGTKVQPQACNAHTLLLSYSYTVLPIMSLTLKHKNIVLFIIFLNLGQTQWYLDFISGSMLMNKSWQCLEYPMTCIKHGYHSVSKQVSNPYNTSIIL